MAEPVAITRRVRVVDGETVCVMGSGPVGLAISLRLADAGRPVVLVDSGRFAAGGQDPALTGGRVTAAADAADRTDDTLLESGSLYQYLQPNYLQVSRYLGTGGTANRWLVRARPDGERLVRLAEGDRADFAARPGLDIPGWAVPAERVTERYGHALAFFGLPGHDHEPAPNAGAFALDRTLLRPTTFRFGPADAVLRARLAEVANHPAIEVRSGVHLVAIDTDRGDRVRSVSVSNPAGEVTTIAADHYVLALGGIENARQLLLAAEEGRLDDRNDVFGRWFCDHPHGRLGFLSDVPAADHRAIAAWHDFQEGEGSPVLHGYELTPEAARDRDLLRFSIELVGRPAGFRSRSMVALAAAVDGVWGRDPRAVLAALPDLARAPVLSLRLASDAARDRLHGPHLGGWSDPAAALHPTDTLAVEAMFEQRPSPDNRIRLGRKRDRFGRRLPSLQWSWSSREVTAIERSAELVAAAFDATGRGRFVTMQELGQTGIQRAGSGWHHLGGTRQCGSPEGGVVDADNRVHGVANLTVAGGSVFPNTVGYANPTLTAVADAIRVADRLLGR